MSISREALEKLVREIDAQASFARHQLAATKAQVAAQRRQQRLTQLTLAQISSIPPSVNLYEGVGKMFKAVSKPKFQAHFESELQQLQQELDRSCSSMVYYENTVKNSEMQLSKMLQAP